MKGRFIFVMMLIVMIVITSSCNKTDNDDIYPVIDMSGTEFFPKDCDTVYAGRSFVFRAVFSDNRELGAYSIDIHNNFNHHTHSSSIVECPLDPIKTPVNPMVFIQEYPIPSGLTNYEALATIAIPSGIDPGDYHLMVRLTDREGWQSLKGISIKVLQE